MANRTTLQAMAVFQKGYAFKSSWYRMAGHPVVRVSDFTDCSVDTNDLVFIPEGIAKDYAKYSLVEGDVVIQTVGSWPSNPASVVGKVIRIPSSVSGALLNQNAVKVLPCSSLDKTFLFYRLKSADYKSYIINTAQGAASQASITLESIRAFEFDLPSMSVQRRIASILSPYDDLVENNVRRIKILEEMAQMIYQEWFVHFRFPGHEKVQMVDSELGPIPEGWSVGRLDDAVVLQRGFDLPKSQRVSGRVPVIAATGPNGTHTEAKVRGPGVVTGRSGSLGTVMLVWEDFWPLNTTLWIKEFRHSTPLHGYFLVKSLDFQTFNSGAAVPTLNRNDVHGLPVALPTREVLTAFDAHCLPLFALKRNLENKNANLRKTRDLLLPKLISGEIPVEAADEKAAELLEEIAQPA